VESGRIEGVIPRATSSFPKEMLRVGDRIRAYVTKIDRTAKGPAAHPVRASPPEFLMRLFELEVPGDRGRPDRGFAPPPADPRHSRQDRREVKTIRVSDPQGTCIGMRGSRVNRGDQRARR